MVDIDQQLANYGDAIERTLLDAHNTTPLPAPDHAAADRHRRAWPVGVAAVAVLVVLALWVGLTPNADETVRTADGRGVFPTRTDTVLVFIGNEDLIVLDLDTGRTLRHPIEGNRAGDHPFWLTETDNHFVVGTGEIYAAPFDGPSRKIDDATIFLPSAHPEAVWTITYTGDYPNSTAEVRLVSIDGTVIGAYSSFDGKRYEPLIGVPDGLAVIDRETGRLSIWDSTTLDVTTLSDTAYIDSTDVDSNGEVIAWCTDACEGMSVHGLDQTGDPTAKAASWTRRIAISPDGVHIATQTRTRLTIHERQPDSGYEPVHQYPIDAPGSIQWTNDSNQLFYALNHDEQGGILGRYDNRKGAWTTIELDNLDYFLGALIALDRTDAITLLDG